MFLVSMSVLFLLLIVVMLMEWILMVLVNLTSPG